MTGMDSSLATDFDLKITMKSFLCKFGCDGGNSSGSQTDSGWTPYYVTRV